MTDKDAAIGRKVMVDELDTINRYEAMADRASPEVADLVRDIADEEKVHVGEAAAIVDEHDSRARPAMLEGVEEARAHMSELPSFESMMKAKRPVTDEDGNVHRADEDYPGKGYQGKGYADSKKNKVGKDIRSRGKGYQDVRHRTPTGRVSHAKGKEGSIETYEPIDHKDNKSPTTPKDSDLKRTQIVDGKYANTNHLHGRQEKVDADRFDGESKEGKKELKKSLDSFEDMLSDHGFEKTKKKPKKKSDYQKKKDAKLPTTARETKENRIRAKRENRPVESDATQQKLNQPGIDPKTGELREERNAQRKGGKYKDIYGRNDSGDEIGGSDSTDRQWVMYGIKNGTLGEVRDSKGKLIGYTTKDGREFPLPPTSVEYSESMGRDRSPETNYRYGNRNSIYNWLASNGGLDRWNRDVAAERVAREGRPENEQVMFESTPEEKVANDYLDVMNELFAQEYAKKHPAKPTIDGTRHISEYYSPQTIIDYFNKPRKSKMETRERAHRNTNKDQALLNAITNTPEEEKAQRLNAILNSDTYKNLYDEVYGNAYDEAYEMIDPEEVLRTYVENDPKFVATGRPFEELTDEEITPYRQSKGYRQALTRDINDYAHKVAHGVAYPQAVKDIESQRNKVNASHANLENYKNQVATNSGIAGKVMDAAQKQGFEQNGDYIRPFETFINGVDPANLNTYRFTPEQRQLVGDVHSRLTDGMTPEEIQAKYPAISKYYKDGAFDMDSFMPEHKKIQGVIDAWTPLRTGDKTADAKLLGQMLGKEGIRTRNIRAGLAEMMGALKNAGVDDLDSARKMQAKADIEEMFPVKDERSKDIRDLYLDMLGMPYVRNADGSYTRNKDHRVDVGALVDTLAARGITTTPDEIQSIVTPAHIKQQENFNSTYGPGNKDAVRHDEIKNMRETATGDGVTELTDAEREQLNDSLGAPGGSMTNDVVPKTGVDYKAAWDSGGDAETGGGNPEIDKWKEERSKKLDKTLESVEPTPLSQPEITHGSENLDEEIKEFQQNSGRKSASFEEMLNARIQKSEDGKGIPPRGKMELIRDPWRMTHLSVNDPVNVNGNDGEHFSNGPGMSVKTAEKNDGVSGAVDEDNRPSQKGTGVEYIAKSFSEMLAEKDTRFMKAPPAEAMEQNQTRLEDFAQTPQKNLPEISAGKTSPSPPTDRMKSKPRDQKKISREDLLNGLGQMRPSEGSPNALQDRGSGSAADISPTRPTRSENSISELIRQDRANEINNSPEMDEYRAATERAEQAERLRRFNNGRSQQMRADNPNKVFDPVHEDYSNKLGATEELKDVPNPQIPVPENADEPIGVIRPSELADVSQYSSTLTPEELKVLTLKRVNDGMNWHDALQSLGNMHQGIDQHNHEARMYNVRHPSSAPKTIWKSFEDMMVEKNNDSFEKISPEARAKLDKLYQNGEIDDTNYFAAIDGDFPEEVEKL